MLTKEQYDALKLKQEAELTAEEKAAILEYDAANAKNSNEHMIPKTRLDEEIQKRKNAEQKLSDLEKQKQAEDTKRLQEQNDFKTLYENASQELQTLRPKAVVADESEKVLQAVLDAQVNEIPEAYRSLIPEEMSVNKRLDWISKNKALLLKPAAFDISAGKGGGGAPDKSADLSQEEIAVANKFGVKPEEYAKHKNKE
jgi:phage I-like protein